MYLLNMVIFHTYVSLPELVLATLAVGLRVPERGFETGLTMNLGDAGYLNRSLRDNHIAHFGQLIPRPEPS